MIVEEEEEGELTIDEGAPVVNELPMEDEDEEEPETSPPASLQDAPASAAPPRPSFEALLAHVSMETGLSSEEVIK